MKGELHSMGAYHMSQVINFFYKDFALLPGQGDPSLRYIENKVQKSLICSSAFYEKLITSSKYSKSSCHLTADEMISVSVGSIQRPFKVLMACRWSSVAEIRGKWSFFRYQLLLSQFAKSQTATGEKNIDVSLRHLIHSSILGLE